MATAVARALAAVISPASAAANVSGPDSPRNGNPGGGQRCTTLSNGVLIVRSTGSGKDVSVEYFRERGGALAARLGWERNGSNTWEGWRNMNAAPLYYSQQWGTAKSCSPFIGKLNTKGGDTFSTPPLPQC